MALAVVVSLVLVLSAPFIGELRRWVQASVPGPQYLWLVNGAVGAGVGAVAVTALVRIRRDTSGRVWRFALIGLAAVVAVVFTRVTGSSNPAVAAVEHFHFVQYGVITWLFYRAWHRRGDAAVLLLPCAAAFVFGVAEEWWQWFLPARVGELADVLLNTVAILCGLLVSVALRPPARPLRGGGARASAAGVLAAAAAVAAFTWTVHVGHAIDDPDIGRFVSRYPAGQLHALAAERVARWAADPPLVRRTLGREDQYRSEGEAHVRARNTAWEQGDVRTAWGENLILERYYAPVLDTPSHISKTGHRWHPDHRADAERRLQTTTAAAPFVSAAAVDTKWVLGSGS
jgi:VanZ family protein